jgi:hypothetical protein
VLSRKVSEDAVLEVLILTAAEENVDNSLLPLSAAVAGAYNSRNVLVKEEVIKSNLLSL